MIITTVRIQRCVADDLNAYTARLQRAVDAHPDRYPEWVRDGRVSAGTAVQYLLYCQERHGERAAKSRAERKERQAARAARNHGLPALRGEDRKASRHANGAADDASAAPTDDER